MMRLFVTTLLLLLALSATGLPIHVAAQQPAAQEEFVPLDQIPPEEQIPAVRLVSVAYAFVWIVMLAYVWSVWRRLSRVEQDLANVERRLTAQKHI
jgi:hypothetical protein